MPFSRPEARYAHGFDAVRKLIAQEMDSGFFSKVGVEADQGPVEADSATVDLLKQLVRQHPELFDRIAERSRWGAGITG